MKRTLVGLLSIILIASLGSGVRAEDEESYPVRVIIDLAGQYDLSQLPGTFESHEERTKAVIEAITKFNNEKLRPLLLIVAEHQEEVEEFTPIPITNSVRVKAPQTVIDILRSANSIEKISVETPKSISELGIAKATLWNDDPTEKKLSWGVKKVNAPKLWEQEIDGSGILTAVIDTGAAHSHLDIAPNIWKNPGETGTDADGNDKAKNGIDDDKNGFVDDVMGWNFEDNNNDISDKHGHGSKTAGIVGGMGEEGTQTGVAPGVTMMIVKSCCGQGTTIFESNTVLGMQYAIQMGVRVISMSLSAKDYSDPTYAKWRRASEVMLAAGIVHVNSAGNLGGGSEPKNIGAPANNPPAWRHPLQLLEGGFTSMITVGATDQDDELRYYSSVGPATWEHIKAYKDFPYKEGEEMGLTKPDVCGPSEIPSISDTGTGYVSDFGGTSSATPVIGGVVSLLLSARPDLTVAQVTEALQMSAVEIESPYNNKCGAGRVDVEAALNYANANFVPLRT